MDEQQTAGIINRLRRLEGQIRGLQRMVAEGRPCEEVLTQVAAIRAGVDRVGLLLVSQRMRECLDEAADGAVASPQAVDRAVQAFLRYADLLR